MYPYAIPSGTNVIPVVSGINNLGASTAPFSTVFTQNISGTSTKQLTINVQALTSSPADGATIFFGTLPKAPVTTGGQSKIYVRNPCTIKRAEIYTFAGTAGSAESYTMYIRVNNTTDTAIASVAAATNERVFSNTALNISLNAGDYFEIKQINPTWATNPLTYIVGGYIYIEE
jgi:hypothetical protein